MSSSILCLTLVMSLCYFTDINECLTNNAGCSDICVNTDGSYQCTCGSGFELDSDNHTCKGT